MRVVAIQEDGEPHLEERPSGPPPAGGLRLRTLATGLCGTDLFKLATGSAAPGTVLGHEIVGEVTAVGDGVRGFAEGDRVVVPHHLACGHCRFCLRGAETQCAGFRTNHLDPGGFADEIRISGEATAASAFRLPDDVDTLDGLFLEPAACVLRSIDRSALFRPGGGESPRAAAILGGGSMGLLHLLVLRALDPECQVLVVDPRPDRRALALGLGATAAVPPGDASLSGFAEAAFDCVGGGELARAAVEALRPGGTAVLFAHARPDEAPDLELNDLFKHEKRLVGAYSGSLGEQRRVFALIANGLLRAGVLVTHRLPLADFAAGVGLARRQEALKVVFEP